MGEGDREDRERQLYRTAHLLRDRVSFGDLPSVVAGFEELGEELDYWDLAFFARRGTKYRGAFVPPRYLMRFISELLASREALSVVDPVAGDGWLAAGLATVGRIGPLRAVSETSTAELLFSRLPLRNAKLVRECPDRLFDASVSMPPFGGPRVDVMVPTDSDNSSQGRRPVRDDFGLAGLLEAADRIANGGVGIWVVPPSFVTSRSASGVRRNLDRFGLHLNALLELPAGGLSATTSAVFGLAVIERQPRDGLFVASVPEDEVAQDELIRRLRSREEGKLVSLGRLVNESEFRGLAPLEAAERVRSLAERKGLSGVALSDVLVEVHESRPARQGQPFEQLKHVENAVYLPTMARTDATTEQGLLPEKLKSYLQLVVDPTVAIPAYLAKLLNSPIGHVIREAASSGATIRRVSRRHLAETTIYLPSLDRQRAAVEALAQIDGRQRDLRELEERVWEGPQEIDDVLQVVRTTDVRTGTGSANADDADSLATWVETLPFPLASILRMYRTVDSTSKDRYERLLFFFEALAAFVSTVHLSALRTNEDLWGRFCTKARSSVASAHGQSWERPSFGLWVTVTGTAASLIRPLAHGTPAERRLVADLYRVVDVEVLHWMSSKKLSSILQEANAKRNRWKGHGGDASDGEKDSRLRAAEEWLTQFRDLVGRSLQEYELIRPERPVILPGPIYECDVQVMTGSNSLFERSPVRLVDPPETNQLYLHCPGHERVLKLEPLVQVKPAPQPACYFYNRREKDEAYLISYHGGAKSHAVDESGGIDVLLAELMETGEMPDAG